MAKPSGRGRVVRGVLPKRFRGPKAARRSPPKPQKLPPFSPNLLLTDPFKPFWLHAPPSSVYQSP